MAWHEGPGASQNHGLSVICFANFWLIFRSQFVVQFDFPPHTSSITKFGPIIQKKKSSPV